MLRWKHGLLIQSWSGRTVHLIYYQSCRRMFIQRFKTFPTLSCKYTSGRLSDTFHSKWDTLALSLDVGFLETVNAFYFWVGDRESVEYSMVVWHGLMYDDRRNVSGSTGRIPQSFATRSPPWQESDTYFSTATASATFALSVSLQVSPSLSSSVLFYLFLWSFVPSACYLSTSVSLVSLLVNLSTLLSYLVGFLHPSLCLLFVPMLLLLVFLFLSYSSLRVFTHQMSLFCHCR